MPRTVRVPVVLLAVLALLLAACGDDVEDVSLDRDAAEEATTTAPDPVGDEGQAVEAEGEAPPHPEAGEDAAGEPGAAAAPGNGNGSAPAPGGAAGAPQDQPAQPQPAQPGTYTYDVEGEVRAGAFTQAHPPEGTLRMDPPDGSQQRSLAQTGDQETEQILRFGADGVHLVYQRTAGPQGEIEFRPQQPVLVFPPAPAAGQEWEWAMESTDGTTTVNARVRLLREETVEVAGASVHTWVMHLSLTLSGQMDATSETTAWVSPEHRLTVKEESEIEGSFGAVTFEGEQRRTIRSLTPG